eukprot:g10534.t1
MPSSPSASLESGVATANLQPSPATHDVQEGFGRPTAEQEGEEGERSPRGRPARPPPTAAETDPADDSEPSLPTLGGLKLSLLGSCDTSRSPPPAFFSASRHGGLGVVSPCESARSSASNKGELGSLPLSDPPAPGGAPRLAKGHHQTSSSPTSSSPCLSPGIDKLLHLPRGRSLRFFIDGDEGLLGNENRIKG